MAGSAPLLRVCLVVDGSADLVEAAELLVLDDSHLAVRPARQPVAIVDRVLGLDDTTGQRGHDPGGLALVLVGVDRGALEVPVLDLGGRVMGLVELRLAGSVGDVAVFVDGVPRADELLELAPLGVDDRLDALRDWDQHGLLHHTVRQVRLGQRPVELDGRHRYVHVNSSSPLSSGESSVSTIWDII